MPALLDQVDCLTPVKPGALRQVRFSVEDVWSLHQQTATWAQRPSRGRKRTVVLLVGIEVLEGAAAETQHEVELLLELQAAGVLIDEIARKVRHLGFAGGDLQQLIAGSTPAVNE